MKNKNILIGSMGTGITAVCCFTPILVIGLTGLGTVAVISYLDYVLFPLLAFFAALTVYGIYQKQQDKKCCELKGNLNTEQ